MLAKDICNTVGKFIQNMVNEQYGMACHNDICQDVASMFINMYVGKIDCGKVKCGEFTPIEFDPTEEGEFICGEILVLDPIIIAPCNTIYINDNYSIY